MRIKTDRHALRAGAPPRRLGAASALLAAGLTLGGCLGGAEAPFLLATGATATTVLEDKLPTDYIAEAVTGLDCSYIRHLDDKGPLCRPERREVIERPLYCYRTLGQIECFEERDPYGIGQRTVN
ncbi:MAG: hypothetical protein NXI21_11540 [Alphaproteobacteria bacterium]|nr:hypothetical protein [Alphaproteobacteria bacterium]